MNGMRAFTDNANVVVRFMQTINCLFFQLRWLENNIRSSSNPQLIIVLILICLIGYLTFGCSQSDSQDSINYFCGERGVSSLIVFALIVGIGYFFYKRYRDGVNNGASSTSNNFNEEREKMIYSSVPSFDPVASAPPMASVVPNAVMV